MGFSEVEEEILASAIDYRIDLVRIHHHLLLRIRKTHKSFKNSMTRKLIRVCNIF
jgi:putative NIF3 family GTP cyclohydrolase 1 type 2